MEETEDSASDNAAIIANLDNTEFAEEFAFFLEGIEADPIKNFIEHKLFMNFKPTAAQRVALKTIFNQELDSSKKSMVWMEAKTKDGDFDLELIEMTETELYKYMTDKDYDVTKIKIKNKIDFIIGRRGGKTTIAAMLAIYCAIITNWKPFLHKTPFATVLLMSHSREFSDEVLEIIRTLIEASPVLKRLVNQKKKNTASTMNLSVPFIMAGKIIYSRVQIKVGAASSKTTRGIAACAVICDEIAFWNLDENMKETDEKILRAVRPATKQFGRRSFLIKISSPSIKQGILYSEHQKWLKGTLPASYAVFKAPSWVWNTILPKEEFIEEWELDEDGFNTEYRANFVDSLSFFIQPEFVDMAIVKGVNFQPPEPKKSLVVYRAAIDAAFKKDHFTFSVIGHFENRVKQYVLKGWEGTKKNPVQAKECAEYIRTICREYGIDEVAADQYAYEPLREIFAQYGVTLVEKTFTLTFKKQIYYNLKRLIHSQQIDLLDHERLPTELKALVIEQTGSGQIRVGHPPGGSDDYADSTAISAFLAVESAGQVGYSMETTLDDNTNHGIKTDINGRAFTAPAPGMLSEAFGYSVNDNSHEFIKDPVTGRLKRAEDPKDEDDDGDSEGPQFIV
jgi:hypothetical protein